MTPVSFQGWLDSFGPGMGKRRENWVQPPATINPAIKKDRLSATITLYLIGIPENCCATI
jgi:hypothetical protein